MNIALNPSDGWSWPGISRACRCWASAGDHHHARDAALPGAAAALLLSPAAVRQPRSLLAQARRRARTSLFVALIGWNIGLTAAVAVSLALAPSPVARRCSACGAGDDGHTCRFLVRLSTICGDALGAAQ